MKALITGAKFNKEYTTSYGTLFNYRIEYDGKTAFYSSKKKDQDYFVVGKESEFTEEEKTSDKGTFYVIKPIREGKFSNFSKQIKKEQSRYSGFAVSYVKDLIIADKIDIKQWEAASEKIFNFMVELDKTIES